jgi:hypothetical protein
MAVRKAAMLAILLAGCGRAPLHPIQDGGASDGAGETAQAPGTVTLRLVVAPGAPYCEFSCGFPTTHITILTAAGHQLETMAPPCRMACVADCERPGECGACDQRAVDFTGEERSWDGRTFTISMCGRYQTACYQQSFAPPGHYIARMCATPGVFQSSADNQPPTCRLIGGEQCIDAPFDLPGKKVVQVMLGAGGPRCSPVHAADYDQTCQVGSDCVNVPEGDFCGAAASTCTNCANAVINANAAPQYEADLRGNTPNPSVCPCPPAPTPVCQNGMCVRGHFGPP